MAGLYAEFVVASSQVLDERVGAARSIATSFGGSRPTNIASKNPAAAVTLHPPIDRDVVDIDPAFGKEFCHVAVGQPVAQVPAHRQQDHIGREPVAGERSGHSRATTNHPRELRLAPDPSTQQCRW